MGDIDENSAVFHLMDSLSAKICHAVCSRMTGTEFVFAVPGERHAADAIIRKLFYAGDVTGKRGAVFDGQKCCGFAGIPRSLHTVSYTHLDVYKRQPLLFAYTLAIGLMAGNSCRVRVSARRTAESEKLCELIDELLELPEFEMLRQRISIITYGRNNREMTENFSRERCV